MSRYWQESRVDIWWDDCHRASLNYQYWYGEITRMNPTKQYRKLQGLSVKAEACLTREEAKKIIRKANKAQYKLQFKKDGSPRKRELDKDQGSFRGSRKD